MLFILQLPFLFITYLNSVNDVWLDYLTEIKRKVQLIDCITY